jgi:hypothetical protein
MSVLRGRTKRLSIYGMAGMLLFFVGGAAVVLAAALGVEWLLALWGVSWAGAFVMAMTGVVKSD